MKNKLTVLDKIKLENYISQDIFLNEKNRIYENYDKIEAHFKILGFNKEEVNYLVSATIMPIDEIRELINYYDNNKCNPVSFVDDIVLKYCMDINNNIDIDYNELKEKRNMVIKRFQEVRKITSYDKKLQKIKKKRINN